MGGQARSAGSLGDWPPLCPPGRAGAAARPGPSRTVAGSESPPPRPATGAPREATHTHARTPFGLAGAASRIGRQPPGDKRAGSRRERQRPWEEKEIPPGLLAWVGGGRPSPAERRHGVTAGRIGRPPFPGAPPPPDKRGHSLLL
ncbi:hypothetical protein H696_06262 [Fonticula alba]|uniref:Uncharacterized protein n=1 Tax=Fonticula alba TaxID=691883 RepID=A0A058YZL2_FONAL|nr:hypothetical protein H696_06262 [Fonticula alba]KCV67311.1 hypothetical protein H696_06262 [Fonticula alba]|eukprot:XP_009498282.1 hypothetical protein H696_06262 [Fonticula alba]